MIHAKKAKPNNPDVQSAIIRMYKAKNELAIAQGFLQAEESALIKEIVDAKLFDLVSLNHQAVRAYWKEFE